MEEREFEQKMSSVKELIKNTTPIKSSIRKDVSQYLVSSLSTIIEMSEKRDKALIRYMELLKEFNFSDEITTPSDIFPGIRTISDNYSPEELTKKTDEMRDCSNTVDTLSKDLDLLINNTLNSLRGAIKNLSDLSIEENQIYDYCIESIKDMDSVYDIGYLKKATN